MSRFKNGVEKTNGLEDAWKAGLSALKRVDRKHIIADNSRKLTGSVDVDTALKKSQSDASRWDYGIGYSSAKRKDEVVHWVEIHPASDGQVNVVLAKLQWLINWLKQSSHHSTKCRESSSGFPVEKLPSRLRRRSKNSLHCLDYNT